MRRIESSCSFQLQEHTILNQHVRCEVTNRLPAKPNRNLNLSTDFQIERIQCDLKRSLVHRFQKSVAQLIVDFIEDPNDLVSYVFVNESVFIRVHLWQTS